MKKNRNTTARLGALVLTPLFAVGLVSCASEPERAEAESTAAKTAGAGAAVVAPILEVDPYWPKPLPNNAIMGWGLGVQPDANNNIWILQRPDMVPREVTNARTASPPNDPKSKENRAKLADDWIKSALKPDGSCCSPFPSFVIQYDQQGNLLKHWGGPSSDYGLDWPYFPHGLHIDYKGNFWIASNSQTDSRVLKFDPTGKVLMAIGTRGVMGDSNDTTNLGAPGSATVDPETNEVYISDGSRNKRIIVFDADTGAYRRHWGAYGNKPDDTPFEYDPNGPPAKQFREPHCAMIAKDGLVYVCDWHGNRIQVFKKDGTFVKEQFIEKATPRRGTVWGIAISRDPEEAYLYVSDGANRKIHVLKRDTLETLYTFGSGGRWPSQFLSAMHNIATDLTGNLYVTETSETARVQKFVYKGVGPVKAKHLPVLWPERTSTN